MHAKCYACKQPVQQWCLFGSAAANTFLTKPILLCALIVPAGPTIPTAVNVPLDMLSDAVRAGQLDPYHSSSIAVVCASGQRSAQATVRLSKVFGFSNVVNVTGGMSAWQSMQAGLSGSGGGCGCGGNGSGGCHK